MAVDGHILRCRNEQWTKIMNFEVDPARDM